MLLLRSIISNIFLIEPVLLPTCPSHTQDASDVPAEMLSRRCWPIVLCRPFADSKQLTEAQRVVGARAIVDDDNIGYCVESMSAATISQAMLGRYEWSGAYTPMVRCNVSHVVQFAISYITHCS